MATSIIRRRGGPLGREGDVRGVEAPGGEGCKGGRWAERGGVVDSLPAAGVVVM